MSGVEKLYHQAPVHALLTPARCAGHVDESSDVGVFSGLIKQPSVTYRWVLMEHNLPLEPTPLMYEV